VTIDESTRAPRINVGVFGSVDIWAIIKMLGDDPNWEEFAGGCHGSEGIEIEDIQGGPWICPECQKVADGIWMFFWRNVQLNLWVNIDSFECANRHEWCTISGPMDIDESGAREFVGA